MSVEVIVKGKELQPPKKLVICERCEAVLSFLPEDVLPVETLKVVLCPECENLNTLRQPVQPLSPSPPAS